MTCPDKVRLLVGEDSTEVIECDDGQTLCHFRRDDDGYNAVIKLLNGLGIECEERDLVEEKR